MVTLYSHTKKLLISLIFKELKNKALATQIIIKHEDFNSKAKSRNREFSQQL